MMREISCNQMWQLKIGFFDAGIRLNKPMVRAKHIKGSKERLFTRTQTHKTNGKLNSICQYSWVPHWGPIKSLWEHNYM